MNALSVFFTAHDLKAMVFESASRKRRGKQTSAYASTSRFRKENP